MWYTHVCMFLDCRRSACTNVNSKRTYSTLQIQGIKRFACLLQTQNALKRGTKRVYYKRKTHVNAVQNACKRGAKRVYSRRQTRLLETRFARLDSTRNLEGQECGSLA